MAKAYRSLSSMRVTPVVDDLVAGDVLESREAAIARRLDGLLRAASGGTVGKARNLADGPAVADAPPFDKEDMAFERITVEQDRMGGVPSAFAGCASLLPRWWVWSPRCAAVGRGRAQRGARP